MNTIEELNEALEKTEARIKALERRMDEMEQVIAVLGMGGDDDE